MRGLTILLIFGAFLFSSAQQKPITHQDYDLWKRRGAVDISPSGNLVAISVVTGTGDGDGYLQIYDKQQSTSVFLFNGIQPHISSDEKYIYFLQRPIYDSLRQQKKKEVKKNEQSKNSFMVYDVALGKVTDSIARVKKFVASDKANHFVILEKYKDLKKKEKDSVTPAQEVQETKKEKRRRLKQKKKEVEKELETLEKRENPRDFTKEDYLIVYQPVTKTRDSIDNYEHFAMPEEGSGFIYTRKQGKDLKDHGIYYYNSEDRRHDTLLNTAWRYKDLAIDKYGQQLAYKVAMDSTEKDSLQFELYYQKTPQSFTRQLGYGDQNIKEGWELTASRPPRFSDDAKRLFFYTQPKLRYTIDTTRLEEEIPDVDVWNYKDRMVQPEQKSRASRLAGQSATIIFDTETESVSFLNDYEMENTDVGEELESRFVIYRNSDDFDIARSWDYPWRADYLVEDLNNRSRKLMINNSGSSPIRVPGDRYAVYFNYDTQDWHSMDLQTQIGKNLTKFIEVSFADEDDDHPALAASHGFGGFDADSHALAYDKYDIWRLDPSGVNPPENITKTGRRSQITYRTYRLDNDQPYLATYYQDGLLLSAFNHQDKTTSLVQLTPEGIKTIYASNNNEVSAFAKAEKSDVLLVRTSSFTKYPDLEILTPTQKSRLTNMNPQQDEFAWGSVELVKWKAYDGTALEGLLYKPAGFDPEKKYPMIVYFYEKYSDRLHQYWSPQPSASTVNFSYLASNGYLVFVPDIVYQDGHPGESAYNCIVSGTEAMERKGFVDSNHMGLQGQSWGGYQTAYLVTRTNKYAAAMAGAPVSNMTNAYGGIRWGSGLSRAFQYERSQSRLGKDLWSGLDLYIENSPLFHIPKIQTPLLMMHNDEDGAVPYYQGIEMFMGMRRLGKPSWLLVYNDEAHNLRKMKNRRDLSLRMMQFFDHYLKGQPAPVWMTEGLPRQKKGKQLGYDLEESEN
ncbi:alpha/beta hydrolase family protein [Nonlabens xiamenensis]|uniref:alpha/beta hydrolase family protein n=1 Tax=Nonlabens xiamenensis TaxID=2341043 RepID=UPI000F60E363|nr:prolyl oligopeptidase family serine peptidase [Nonlabens xiamenensis]